MVSSSVLQIYAYSEEHVFNVDQTTDQFGMNETGLNAISISSIKAYATLYNYYDHDGIIIKTPRFTNVQDYLIRTKELGQIKYFPVSFFDPDNRAGTQARNGNSGVTPVSFMINTDANQKSRKLWIKENSTFCFVYLTNANSNYVDWSISDLENCTTSTNRQINLVLTEVVSTAQNNSFYLNLPSPYYNGANISDTTPLNSVYYTPLYIGYREYMPADLIELVYPTNPTVDAINYKADRIIEQLTSLNSESGSLASILAQLEQLNVTTGTVEEQLETVQSIINTLDTHTQDSIEEAATQITNQLIEGQEYIEDLTDPEYAETYGEDNTSELITNVQDDIEDLLPVAIDSLVEPVERFLQVSETGQMDLPIPLFPEKSWTFNPGAFFSYNYATAALLEIIRWLLRYELAKHCANYVLNKVFILLGAEAMHNLLLEVLPL